MSAATPVGPKAQRRNAALEPLAYLIGEWRTESTHPAVPRRTLAGVTTIEWHQGGAFLLLRSEVAHPDFPDGVALFASDDVAGTVAMNWFDERGVSRLYRVVTGDRTMTWSRDDPKLAQRVTITADGADRLVGTGEMAADGGAWGPDLSQVFTRR